ncbi:phage tail tape measure protein, lambda family [Paracoccus isoporae]|uniref:Phage tail tape measure protein, lambda family n=2 Tax=Paracoccus isoporae TaxID=591205 RepID=A0A1G7EVK8_9RHOB|nr:phage tail tape measure protein, lambda family [Paracoccus isoporae]
MTDRVMPDTGRQDDPDGQIDKAARMTAAFTAELGRMQKQMWLTGREVDGFARGIRSALGRAFDGMVLDGLSLRDAMGGVARGMADTAYGIATKLVKQALAGVLAQGVNQLMSGAMPAAAQQGATPFAAGAAFSQGRVAAFAKGGIVTSPTRFPMRGGVGLMGEAGPEAIMPLSRGADGRLGVAATGGGAAARPVNVSITVNTPDVAGFARSQSQIAAHMGRALARGQRNL